MSAFSLKVECQEEWTTTYIFINKAYQFNIWISDSTESSTPSQSVSCPFANVNITVVDQDDNPLDLSLNEYSISPSPVIALEPGIEHSFTVSIHKLSMNHGDSPFRLRFTRVDHEEDSDCTHNGNDINGIPSGISPELDCSTPSLTAARVINYKLAITSHPDQLQSEDPKFYKDVKPKSNFLEYVLELRDHNGNTVVPPPRCVPIRCSIYFADGTKCENQKALNLKGRSPGIGGHRRHSDVERSTLKHDGSVQVLLRIEETSSKYDNRRFKVEFAADSCQITDNLDIAPIVSAPFLVRTKINKYRLKGKGHRKKGGNDKAERSSTKRRERERGNGNGRKSESVDPHPLPPSALDIDGGNGNGSKSRSKSKSKALCPGLPGISMSSSTVPPIFATPAIVDSHGHRNNNNGGSGSESTSSDRDPSTTNTLPSLHPSDDSENVPIPLGKHRGKKRKRHREQHRCDDVNLEDEDSESDHHDVKRRKVSRHHQEGEVDVSTHYVFHELSSDIVLKPMVIESLRTLHEAMGRREYFVSSTECHCYLKCLCCGQTAYPPKEQVVQHSDGCLLSMIYSNMTRCVAPQVLQQALHLNADGMDHRHFVPPIPKLNLLQSNNINNNNGNNGTGRNGSNDGNEHHTQNVNVHCGPPIGPSSNSVAESNATSTPMIHRPKPNGLKSQNHIPPQQGTFPLPPPAMPRNRDSNGNTQCEYQIPNIPNIPNAQNTLSQNGCKVSTPLHPAHAMSATAGNSRRSSFHPIPTMPPATYSMSPAFPMAMDANSMYGTNSVCGYAPYLGHGYARSASVGSRRLSGLLDRVGTTNLPLELAIEGQRDIAATTAESKEIAKNEGMFKEGKREQKEEIKLSTTFA